MKQNEYYDKLNEMAEGDEADIVEEETTIPGQEKPLDMEGSLEYSILLKEKDMRHFMFRHTYSSVSGWFGVLISIAAFVMLIMGLDTYGTFEMIALAALSVMFTIVQPLQIISRAKKQIKQQKSFNEPIVYNLCKDGIVIRQGEQFVNILWSEVRKVVETKKAVMVYVSPIRAFIFPKDQIDNLDTFMKVVRQDGSNAK